MAVKRILIDCSDTYTYNLQTGIQRVVRNIVSRTDLMEKKLGVSVVPVILTKYGYINIENFLSSLPSDITNITNKTSFKKKVKFYLKNKNEITYNIVQTLWDFYYGCIYHPIKNFLVDFISSIFYQKNTLIMNETDLLFIIDAFWQITYTENKLFFKIQKKLKKKGGKVAYLVYDIIPITNKEIVIDTLVNAFEKSFNKIIKYTDFYITISKSEQRNIANYLKSQKINKPIEYFYLGADLPKSKEDESIQSDIFNITKNPYFLIVGTIEPRKGQSIVVEAFEYLWNNGFSDALVIVGKYACESQNLLNRILSSPYYNKKLFMFNICNDSELNFLYNNTKALIFASQREGFGLPLVEAMQYKKPIIASDIEVFREVGGAYPIYFKPYDVNDLINKIKFFIKQPHNVKEKETPSLLSWDESLEMLCDKLKNFLS
ncbi:alpha-1,2-rhamnosyltransferase [Desulfurella multipotens]|uniref:Alpha-1,2-rhamnosyltransferase n=1 Tax=Desulfurella multipotens TaxID=79269 RepID=A0A1G6QW28_9BACT|nr:glycosyltransferase family 1 protein [Desulfurella multipotens]SDC96164.1 alpha-1,2-rhamnosyltransferase [Desulfurella multipotens]